MQTPGERIDQEAHEETEAVDSTASDGGREISWSLLLWRSQLARGGTDKLVGAQRGKLREIQTDGPDFSVNSKTRSSLEREKSG